VDITVWLGAMIFLGLLIAGLWTTLRDFREKRRHPEKFKGPNKYPP